MFSFLVAPEIIVMPHHKCTILPIVCRAEKLFAFQCFLRTVSKSLVNLVNLYFPLAYKLEGKVKYAKLMLKYHYIPH